MRFALALVAVAVPAIAHADGEAMPTDDAAGDATRTDDPAANRINLRVGNATSDSTGRPTICVDVRVIRGFAAETCGTGQGVIHDQAGTELAHFRGTFSFLSRRTSTGTAKLRGGLGWAELQVGVDHPGFHFGEPDTVDRGSVAGPEAVVQAQYLVPLGKGIEAIASLTAGVAVFANADKLVVPQSNAQPFVSGEIGFGW
ncbi:MAG TPA: hypothetical protein VMZ53_26460 [Kofleriaceae bacterium]|nr:hypothetical protein [Kofleriaceae bacterium]